MNEKEPSIKTYSEEEIQIATKELESVGISPIPTNIDTYMLLKATKQWPKGYDDLYANKDNPEILKQLMEEKNIQMMIHVEGPDVRCHTKLGLQLLEQSGYSEQEQRLLKQIIFHHDIGKHEVVNTSANTTQTISTIGAGKLFQTMIGHAGAALDTTKTKLEANGLNKEEVALCLKTIENHMNTDILQRKNPKKIIAFFTNLGKDEKEIKKHIYYLTVMLHIDSLATENIRLHEGNIDYSKDRKKSEFTHENVRNKYTVANEGIIKIQKNEKNLEEKLQDCDTYLPKIAEITIPKTEENATFRDNPDNPNEHEPKRHEFGIITHTKKVVEHFFTRNNRIKQIKDDVDTHLSETIDGKTKEELIAISIVFHDIGKFFRTVKYDGNKKTYIYENHEALGREIISHNEEIHEMIKKRYDLTDKQLTYVSNCIGLHYELSKIRDAAKLTETGYTIEYIYSQEFTQECEKIQANNPEYAKEIGLLYLCDSLAKTDITVFGRTDQELSEKRELAEELVKNKGLPKEMVNSVGQKTVNVFAAKKYLMMLYKSEK